ncbi:hypothetical protein J1N10_11225 [Carboxylicivirga sp. A043]|uniref:hypothetical protein n=1 Tax=Carboxylicivirga litoralis TaxID=2816963 RepID=UPI0021CB86AC|nr:hypothetical protein [Carboxylicivirga sp. A043]MCU4156548.1 hypothetical protein [Carboxylicivirga sp. A043]
MAYHKDYILRMMEMMAEMIAVFLGLLKKGDIKQAEKRLNNAYREFLKEDAAFFHQLPITELTTQLLEQHNYTHQHLKVLSELFYAEGELSLKKGNTDHAKQAFEKALIIREFTDAEAATFSFSEQQRMNQLKAKITNLNSL